jgi:hypothetical protein
LHSHQIINLIENRYAPRLAPDEKEAFCQEDYMETRTETIRGEAEREMESLSANREEAGAKKLHLINIIENRYAPQMSPDDRRVFYKYHHLKIYSEAFGRECDREQELLSARREAANAKIAAANASLELANKHKELAILRARQALSGMVDELAKSGVDWKTACRILKNTAGKIGGAGGEGNEKPSGASS